MKRIEVRDTMETLLRFYLGMQTVAGGMAWLPLGRAES